MIKELVIASMVVTVGTAGGDIAEIYGETTVVDSPKFYVGGGVAYDNALEEDEFSGTLVGGYDFNEYVGGEVRVSSNGDFETYSGFIKPQYPIGEANVYGLVGYEYVDVLGEDVDSYAVGAGVEYAGIRLDTVYSDNTEEYKTLASYVYKF